LKFGTKHANTWQLAVALGEVEAVSDYEFVGDSEAHKVSLEVDTTGGFFIEQHTGL
jgi:hypothetical protein